MRGKALVGLRLKDGSRLRGEVVWADSTFIKLTLGEAGEVLVPKNQVTAVEALSGTETIPAGEIAGDPWAERGAEVA